MPAKGSKGFASEAQREAARRNLLKGNPNAFTKGDSQGEAESAPAAAASPPAPRAPAIRARTSSPKRREPSPQATPPAAPASAPAAPPKPQAAAAPPSQKKHFLDDVLGGLFK